MTVVAIVLVLGWFATAAVLYLVVARVKRLAVYCSGSNAFMEACVNNLLALRTRHHSSGWPSLVDWRKLPWPKWSR